MKNLDRLQRFPKQNQEHRYFECTQETRSDILANVIGMNFDPGFGFGATFRLTGKPPADTGLDPIAAFQSNLIYGDLPTEKEDFDALTTSELYEANFDNYSPEDKQFALYFAQRGVKRLYSYDEIVANMNRFGIGVGIAVKWFESFNVPNQDGSLPAPIGPFSFHMVAAYEETPLGLRCKDWVHDDYVFISRANLGLIFQSAVSFDPTAWQWLQRVQIALSYPQRIPDILPLLKSLN